jgi:CrcB protein
VLLGVGFLGAFTTFSTLTYETLEAMRVGDLTIAAVNVVASLAVGLAACWLGLVLGQRL